MLFKYINLKAFLISLSIGLLYVYLNEDHKKTIIMYPTPDNVNTVQYVDNANNCFTYDLNEVQCPESQNEYHEIKVEY
jgi:hypothetical protein